MEISEKKFAIVTAAIGKKYLDLYNKKYRKSHERFAEKNNCHLYVITDHIDNSAFGHFRHPAWQALLIFQIEELKKFDYILWIEGDVFITNHCKNIFELLPQDKIVWMVAKNNAYNISKLSLTDTRLYDQYPKEGKPDFLLNLGVFLAHRTQHQKIMEGIYHSSPEQPCYYQGPLSYAFLTKYDGIVLPSYFNTIINSYRDAYGPEISTIAKCYNTNGFIHFAGQKNDQLLWLIRCFDTCNYGIFSKIPKIIENKKIDWIIRKVLNFLHRNKKPENI